MIASNDGPVKISGNYKSESSALPPPCKRKPYPEIGNTLWQYLMLILVDDEAEYISLSAFIALSAAQSSAQTHIQSAIVVIDTSNNAWHSQVDWLVGTPYLAIKASNVSVTSKLLRQATLLAITDKQVWMECEC